jgi:hypothetical protein
MKWFLTPFLARTGRVGPQRQALAAIGENFDDASVNENAQMQRLAVLEIQGTDFRRSGGNVGAERKNGV